MPPTPSRPVPPGRRPARRLLALLAVPALVVSVSAALLPAAPATASVTRIRLGSSADVSRTAWNGPAYVMNGSGAVVPASMARAVDAVRGGTGTLDVVVLAGSTGSTPTPECDVIMKLAGVNSCTTLTLTRDRDGDDRTVNADVRNAELVYFAGGNQCRYVGWKGTALEASVESVVAKGGGSGGGSAGHHVNSSVVYDGCDGSVTSAEALADPYRRSVTFTTGMFSWPHYGDTVNDSHFVSRNRMGRLMAFTARAVKDGLTSGGAAWGVGVEEGGGSLYVDRTGLATVYGPSAYVVVADHQPERVVAGQPLTYRGYKIWKLPAGATFDFAHRPACGYYLVDVVDGALDRDPYSGTPVSPCAVA